MLADSPLSWTEADMGGISVVFVVALFSVGCVGAVKVGEAEAWKNQAIQRNTAEPLSIGLIVPKTNFGVREYIRAVNTAVGSLHRGRGPKLTFFKKYELNPKSVNFVMFSLTPSPTG